MSKVRINYNTDIRVAEMQKAVMGKLHLKKPQFSEKVIDFYLERLKDGKIEQEQYRRIALGKGNREIKDYTYLPEEYVQKADACAEKLGVTRGQFLYYATFEYCSYMESEAEKWDMQNDDGQLQMEGFTEKEKSIFLAGITNVLVLSGVPVTPAEYEKLWNTLNGKSDFECELKEILRKNDF